jgi:hypothetical protein
MKKICIVKAAPLNDTPSCQTIKHRCPKHIKDGEGRMPSRLILPAYTEYRDRKQLSHVYRIGDRRERPSQGRSATGGAYPPVRDMSHYMT